MTPKPLFVYGTLQDADILGAALGRAVDVSALKPAMAPGYRTVFFPDRVYPALVPAEHQHAAGLLLECLQYPDLAALDAFEGEEYRRGEIHVVVNGATIAAEVYLPVIPLPDTQPAWTLDQWTRHHKPSVLAGEIEAATTLRQRLSEESAD